MSSRNDKVHYWSDSLFYCWLSYGLRSPENLWVSFFRTDSVLGIYHLFVWSNLNFLHNSQGLLPHRIMSYFMFFLRKFVAFAYYVINRFVFITISSTRAISLRLICFSFIIILISLFCTIFRRLLLLLSLKLDMVFWSIDSFSVKNHRAFYNVIRKYSEIK